MDKYYSSGLYRHLDRINLLYLIGRHNYRRKKSYEKHKIPTMCYLTYSR